jgi:UbiD family decarboxylase
LTSGDSVVRSHDDLQDHIERLDAAGLLYRIDVPVNKDTEMHALVRWQFRGGIPEEQRRAFLFSNIVDSTGRRFEGMRVVVGAYAASSEIYRIGMGVETLDDIGRAWERAIANPIKPRLVSSGPVHDVVIEGAALRTAGGGLESLPIPISTPGFDAAPYLTATCVVTRDPENGVQNLGTYRGQLKGPNRLGMMMLAPMRAGGYEHWKKHNATGKPMPIAIILGCPPVVGYQGPQKLPRDVDELDVAGGLAGAPIDVVRCKTVDLLVPADCELVIEGFVDPTYVEPEGPFGESHGYVALEDYNMIIEVTAITHRRAPVISSIISQVTPSESSVVKRLAYEPIFLKHLRDGLGIKSVRRVVMHEPLTNLRRFVFLQFERGTARSEIWRALQGTIVLQAAVGKWVIAVDDDIDPLNVDAVFWAMSYRCDPAKDTQIVPYREAGHGPRSESQPSLDSCMLVDATMKRPMPPLALPKREFMENAQRLWEKLGLPQLRPESPWFGYSLGDWSDEWDARAMQATRSTWSEGDESYRQRRRRDVLPNTPVRGAAPDDS